LYRTTGNSTYKQYAESCLIGGAGYFGWNDFQYFGREASWAYIKTNWSDVNVTLQTRLKEQFRAEADAFYTNSKIQPYFIESSLSTTPWICWGTLGMNIGSSYFLLLSYDLFNDSRYVDVAYHNLDIAMGSNPLSRSFITGIGEVSPMDPLSNQVVWDNVTEPIPGINVFGSCVHLSFNNDYYMEMQSNYNNYPAVAYEGDPYPILRRYADDYHLVQYNEFAVGSQSAVAPALQILSKMGSNNLLSS